MARRFTLVCWAVVMDWPNSGMKEAIDCTSTGGGLAGGGAGVPGRTYSGGRIGVTGESGDAVPGSPLAAAGFGMLGVTVPGGRGRERISPERRSFQVISTAKVVSASRISFN